MKLFFGGSEIKKWRDMLIEQKVPAVSLSFVGLTRRSANISDKWKISSNYPSDQEVFLDSGAYTLNKPDSGYTVDQAREIAENYMLFVQENIDDVALVSEFDANILGQDVLEAYRTDFYDNLPSEKFMPIWHVQSGIDELEKLASRYDIVGVTQADMHDTSLSPVFNSIISRYGVRLHGVAITGRDMMKQVKWDSVSSTSWLSPAKFGDTIIWTGRELRRYPKAYKDRARKSHRNLFTDIGLDYKKIDADDSNELLKLSVWSWQQFVNSLSSVTTHSRNEIANLADTPLSAVGIHRLENRNEELIPSSVIKRETRTLPVFGTIRITEQHDDGSSTETPYTIKRTESNRICNTCFLREKCPAFMRDANCAYNIPIEIKTKEQLRALQDAMIEMQAQRVAFMQFSEDLEGGYADPNLSSELDRLQRMIKAKQDAERDRLSINIEATSANTGPGFFEQVFGSGAATKMRAIEPVRADDLIKESEIYEGEVVG